MNHPLPPSGDDLDRTGADGADVEGPPEAEVRRARVEAAGHAQRLDKVLVGLAPEFSRNHLQSLIERGCVRVDASVVDTASRKVRAGQQIEVTLEPTAESTAFRPEPMELAVVHEDAYLLVIDKPAGLVVHPAAGHWGGTLLNGLLARDPAAARLPRAGIVHRLDKDTSGLMVVARTLAAHTELVRAIAAREVRREYLALAWGRVEPAEQAIEAPVGRDPVSRTRMAVVPHGKPARTDVRRLLCGEAPLDPARVRPISLVACRLHTGRTHQIRVHLQSIGHPLVADTLYGGAPALGLRRQALHARVLGLRHPVDGQALRFVASPPDDFRVALKTLVGDERAVATMSALEGSPVQAEGSPPQ